MAAISGTTRLCALLGAPVSHSQSPAMHNAAFAHLGLDLAYVAMNVERSDLKAAIDGARALGFVGLNLTAPHKEAALEYCEPDPIARAVGAVNTIVFADRATCGYNTDVDGLRAALSHHAAPRRALVLGAGGAARAAAYVLAAAGVETSFVARSARTMSLAGLTHAVKTIDEISALDRVDLLVDATPVSLADAAPLVDVRALHANTVVLDLRVLPSTALTRAAQARGLAVQLGDVMLLHQGARAFSLFTGLPAPVDVMRAALSTSTRARSAA